MKLFEIPIYAIDKQTFIERVNKREQNLMSFLKEKLNDSDRNKVIELDLGPQKIFEYNHIIGFIVFSADDFDIIVDIYFPYVKKKYYWHSSKKIFLSNFGLNGGHFRYCELPNNLIIEEIIKLFNYALESLPRNCFVDSECFDNIVKHVSFRDMLIN